jgi:serine/threonine-protein kinase
MSLVGRQIGRYRIVEQLGQGGMSVVYKGIDTALDREVAVKVLHPHLAQRPESRKRLEREAKAVARLRHPNILEVYDYANENVPEAFIVTELIRGRTLREFISTESLQPPEIAAMVVHEIACALAHAHETGVLHRDLKPENVMVREDGVLKLMDFGIAKILDRDEKMTMTGALVGSPAHMAPEIIEGEEAGAEADVFSLGTMLYLFATGKLPFTAPNTTATLKKILDGVYDDPRQFVPTVSDELAEIIATCLQRQPANRFTTAAAMRDALADLLASVGITRVHEELPRFVLDPRGYRKELVPRVTAALLQRAEALVLERKPARAMAALNQVLAHDPNNARASALFGQMQTRKQREARTLRLRRLGLSAAVSVVAVLGLARGLEVATRPPTFVYSQSFLPWEIALTNAAWASKKPAPGPGSEAAAVVPDGGTTVALAMLDPAVAKVNRPGRVTSAPRSEATEVVVVVRPFGYLQVDDGPRSAEALSRHTLRLAPGRHRFLVTCQYCEAAEHPVEQLVSPGEEVRLVAPLKPSQVTFTGFPPGARVRVGNEERSASQAEREPFRVAMPAGGSTKMQHLVEWEVTVNGVKLEAGSRWVEPGTSVSIQKAAAP